MSIDNIFSKQKILKFLNHKETKMTFLVNDKVDFDVDGEIRTGIVFHVYESDKIALIRTSKTSIPVAVNFENIEKHRV